jgi:hypothetical protein
VRHQDLTTEKKREGQAQPISDSAGETETTGIEEIGRQEGDEEELEEERSAGEMNEDTKMQPPLDWRELGSKVKFSKDSGWFPHNTVSVFIGEPRANKGAL